MRAKKLLVTAATSDDVKPIADNMRKEDVDEVYAAAGLGPHEALRVSLQDSSFTWTIRDPHDERLGMFGVGTLEDHDFIGIPWLLGTPGLVDYSIEFIRRSKWFIDLMFEIGPYTHLANYVDARNEVSLRWLQRCGFERACLIEDYGYTKVPFWFMLNTKE